jgi:hypothetical protein
VLTQLVGIVCLSIATGMLFIQGFEKRLRGNPPLLDAGPCCGGFSGSNNFVLPEHSENSSLAVLPASQRCADTR